MSSFTEPKRPELALVVICAATLLALADYTGPAAVLPTLTGALHASPTAQTWLLNGITFGLAVLLLSTGSLADDHGRRRVFVLGTAGLAVSTAAGALAGSAWPFVAARIAQGIAAAAVLAAGLGLLAHLFPPGPHRLRATATWGSMIGLGVAIGPVGAIGLGAIGDWRTFYWVIAAAALAVAVVARLVLVESRAVRARRLDLGGVLLLTAALTALLVGTTNGRGGWLRPETVLPVLLAIALFALFAWTESRVAEPMIEPGLFARPPFLLATLGALASGIAVVGPMTFLPTALQRGSGLSATQTAFLASGWAFTMFVVGQVARRLWSTEHGGAELAGGFALSAAGALIALLFVDAAWGWLFVGLVVAGVGGGLIIATLPRLAIGSVPPERAAMGSGANNTARYLGSALGVAVTASVATTSPTETLVLATALGAVAAVAVLPLAARVRVAAAAPEVVPVPVAAG